nr:MAG TPA: hypothetical protein [Caudoviricetes sp.]
MQSARIRPDASSHAACSRMQASIPLIMQSATASNQMQADHQNAQVLLPKAARKIKMQESSPSNHHELT